MQFFLLGFMGCGKSFWGKRLARRYQLPHIDLDEYIEEKTHRSIQELFKLNGELYFRELESNSLQELIDTQSPLILSTGGGTPCNQRSLDLMNHCGKTIYLEASVNYLFEHIKKNPGSRPLLRYESDDSLRAMIELKLKTREFYYQQAHYTVQAGKAEESIFDYIFKPYV